MTEKYRNPLLYIKVIGVSSMREVCDMSRLTHLPFYINLSVALREGIKHCISLNGVALPLLSEVFGYSLKILKRIFAIITAITIIISKRENVKLQILIILLLQLLLLLLLILKLLVVIGSTTAATAFLQLLLLLLLILLLLLLLPLLLTSIIIIIYNYHYTFSSTACHKASS